MYAAFNTLQLELERLIILHESMTSSPSGSKELDKIKLLDIKIKQHQDGLKVLLRTHLKHQRLIAQHARARASMN